MLVVVVCLSVCLWVVVTVCLWIGGSCLVTNVSSTVSPSLSLSPMQNESPAKTDRKEEDSDTVAMALHVLEDIIGDVMTSATTNPSVPAVVFEVVTEIVASGDDAQAEKGEEEGGSLEYSENDISDIIDLELAKEAEVRKEAGAGEQNKVDDLEVQEVKVQVAEEEKEESKDEPKVITFGGKPVPETGVVVFNGYITSLQDSPPAEGKAGVSEQAPKPSTDSSVPKRQSAIPQTDLDTFETRLTNEHGSSQELDVSNPDDDTSDKKSDTGSVNTMDSVEKEADVEPSAVAVTKRKKGNIRPRNVRRFSVSLYLCLFSLLCAPRVHLCGWVCVLLLPYFSFLLFFCHPVLF